MALSDVVRSSVAVPGSKLLSVAVSSARVSCSSLKGGLHPRTMRLLGGDDVVGSGCDCSNRQVGSGGETRDDAEHVADSCRGSEVACDGAAHASGFAGVTLGSGAGVADEKGNGKLARGGEEWDERGEEEEGWVRRVRCGRRVRGRGASEI